MLKLLSLFSGIGAFEKALTNIGESFEVVNYCEIDKYASEAYSLIHNLDENMNLGDITTVDTKELPNDIDILTYGFPCQDISIAGKMTGFVNSEGEITRSGLFFQALRIIEDTQPKIAIAENVKALTGKRFTAEFKIVLDSLNAAGYKNYWAVLNAKDYGVPQNRERVFIISIRNDIAHGFKFPEKYELKLRLKDLLEESVDEKYFLSDQMINYLYVATEKNKAKNNGHQYKSLDVEGVARCITTREGTRINNNFIESPKRIGNIYGEDRGTGYAGNVWDKEAISPTLTTMSGGNRQPLILEDHIKIKNATKQGYIEAHEGDYVNLQFPNSETRRGRVINQCSGTLQCNDGNGVIVGEHLRIRKLTPKECFRLMGFDDEDVDVLIDNGISNTQLYKMAGNSIVVDVLEEIFVELLNQYENVFPYNEVVTA